MRNYDLGSGLFCLLIGLGFVAGGLKMGLGPLNAPGAGFFPAMIGLIFSILSAVLLMTTVLEKKRAEQKPCFWKAKAGWVKVSQAFLSLIFYMVSLEFLGYIVTTVLFILFLLKVVGKKSWVVSILMAILVSLASYALFKMMLGVALPKGVLQWVRW